MNPNAPAFPLAAGAVAPLRARHEAQGSGDYSPLWAGQAASGFVQSGLCEVAFRDAPTRAPATSHNPLDSDRLIEFPAASVYPWDVVEGKGPPTLKPPALPRVKPWVKPTALPGDTYLL